MATVAPIAAFLAAAVAGGLVGPLVAQVKRVPVAAGARQFGVGFLAAAPDSFDFVIRATGDLFVARVGWTRTVPATNTGTAKRDPATGDSVSWSRPVGVAAKEATLRISGLLPASSYRFVFSLFRKPTGNESRQIEAYALDTLRGVFAAAPTSSLDSLLPLVDLAIARSVSRVLPATIRSDTAPKYPRDTAELHEYLKIRLVDRHHAAYRRQADLATDLATALERVQDETSKGRFPALRTLIAAKIGGDAGVPELRAPALGCDSVEKKLSLPDLGKAGEDRLIDGLRAVHAATAVLSTCRGLLRDIRLDRYLAVRPRPDSLRQIADELLPVSARLEELKAGLEEQLAIWRRRDAAIRQVSQDLRRAAEASIRAVESFTVDGRTAPRDDPPSTVAGLGLAVTALPCANDETCLRLIPNATIGLRMSRRAYLDLGLTLANTESSGRTRHLFWFSSLMIGPSIRLGATPGRLGAGLVILRGREDRLGSAITFGGYLNLTVIDFRL